MEKENLYCDRAQIERGIIETAANGLYTVRSYGREGLVTPEIPAIIGAPYSANEKVYFFLFDDGKGAIIGRFA